MNASLVAAVGAEVATLAFGLFLRYRRDLNAARARLAAVERHVISTPWGAVEYAEEATETRCSSCTGSFTTASEDWFPSATFPTVDSLLPLDSAISVRAWRRMRRQAQEEKLA